MCFKGGLTNRKWVWCTKETCSTIVRQQLKKCDHVCPSSLSSGRLTTTELPTWQRVKEYGCSRSFRYRKKNKYRHISFYHKMSTTESVNNSSVSMDINLWLFFWLDVKWSIFKCTLYRIFIKNNTQTRTKASLLVHVSEVHYLKFWSSLCIIYCYWTYSDLKIWL